MDCRSYFIVVCLMCSIIAAEEIVDDKKNPIINLFEAPLHAFKAEPGEAIAVFEPELVRQAANDTNGISSWFQAGQNIGSAAGAITGWIRNRISTSTTTNPPEVIVQVHQVDRPKPVDNNNVLDSIRLGPNKNVAKRKKQKQQQQEIDDEIDAELDLIDEQMNKHDEEDDDDDDDSNDVDNYINHNKRRRHKNRNQVDREHFDRVGNRNRNIKNNFRYEYDDDEEEDEYDDDDDSYRRGYESDNEDDDDDDDEEYYSYINQNAIHRRGPAGNRVNYNRIQPNRRPIQYISNTNPNRPPIRRIQQNDFYRPFQDMPPLAKPIRYGVNNNNNFQPQAIGVLKQQQMIQRRKQQQQLQQQLQQKQKLQKQQQNSQQKQQEQVQQNQKQQENRPHVDLLLNGQNHVLIPVQVLPSSIPYQQILPQIQVVAQHHHTIEQQPTDEPATTIQPNRRTRRPNRRRPDQNFDEDRRPSRRSTTSKTTRRPTTTRRSTTTRRPSRSTRTTRRTTTTTTTMPPKLPEKGNKFELNRRKPVVSRSDTPAAMSDVNRPDPPLKNEEQEEESGEEMSQYKPPEPVMDEARIDEENKNDDDVDNNNDDDDGDKVEPKSGEARSQYYLPQRYYKILGSNSYLALNNNGRFLLRTGRNTNSDKKDVVIKVGDNDSIKIGEIIKDEKLLNIEEVSTKPIVEDSAKVIQSVTKLEIEDPKLLVTQVKTTEENVNKDVKQNDKSSTQVKEDMEKINESISFTSTTESPLKVEKENPIVTKVEMIIKPTEKVILKSEVVQEKQNGNLIIKSENAAASSKVESMSIEKTKTPHETT